MFNILVYERRLRHRELHKKSNPMKEFDIGYLVEVRKHVKSTRKDGIDHKLVFRTKDTYRVLEKDTMSSYWLQHFPFCDGIGRTGIKVK